MRVYEYGALEPTENLETVDEQMHRAHRYRNKLTEIERSRRESVRLVMETHTDTAALAERVHALDASIDEARGAISKGRARTRSAATDPAHKAHVKALCVEAKAARATLRAAKAAIREDAATQAALAAIEETSREAIRQARGASGLYWGTYSCVEAAAEQARKTAVAPPAFQRWDGSGHLAVQTQNGLSVELAEAQTDTRVRVSPVPDGARGKAQRTVVRVRVGSDDARGPVWATVPIVMHRPLPRSGVIKWAHLLRWQVADRMRWKVQFVVDESACTSRRDHKVLPGRGTCAIDVGWRLLGDGSLRVAMLVDDAGRVDSLALPAGLVTKDEHTDSLASIRSKVFDEIKPRVVEWLAGTDLEERSHAHAWRSPMRMKRLLEDHGDKMPAALANDVRAFRETNRHLWQWQEHERVKVRQQRLDLYRRWSVDVARRYGTVVIEALDLRVFARREQVEDGTHDSRRHLRLRGLAAISILRSALTQACAARSTTLASAPAAHTTMTCAHCGHVDDGLVAAARIEVRCPQCGQEDDQDVRAARNLLASAEVARENAEALAARKAVERPRFSAKQRRMRGLVDAVA